jgi:ATP-dependent DNA helicase RecQ
MKAERPARILLPPRRGQEPAAGAGTRRDAGGQRGGAGRGRGAELFDLGEEAAALFEALRAHRLSLARGQGVPPYVIASDRTLREIAATRPRSLGELLSVHGIGDAKARRYGAGFLDVVSRTPPSAPGAL